jgi:predicted membrane protein
MRMTAPTPRVTDLGRLLVGLVVLTMGVLFLLDSADVLNASRTLDRWWPAVLVAAGLLTLAERPPAVTRGVILTAIGAALLLFTTDVVHGNAWDYLWPAAIIVAGITVLRRWSGRPTPLPVGASAQDVVRATAVFGGPKVASSSQSFRGAWLTAIFGGVELDLRGARPAPDGAAVNVTTLFGGADILVPHGWRISVRSTPIFGGVDDKTEHDAPPPDDAPELRIDAVTIFGGIAVKHDR